jgi:hypothetical protein
MLLADDTGQLDDDWNQGGQPIGTARPTVTSSDDFRVF